MSIKATILGCGASAGVPLIGCECAVCTSENLKNKRSRASVLIEKDGFSLLVDVSPDLRQQALSNGFKQVDAIYVTHAHADHCHGIDDVRSLNFHAGKALPLYSDTATLNELQDRFAYVFQKPSEHGWIRAAVDGHSIAANKPIKMAETFEITPFAQEHGRVTSYGLRIDNFAYCTDVKRFAAESEAFLYNLDVWVVDCLCMQEKPTHAHLDLALNWIDRYKPKRAILTHLSHDFDYETLQANTPQHVDIAYDGMIVHSS